MHDKVKTRIAAVLKCSSDHINAQQNVSSLGVDSLMAVELAVLLRRDLGVEVTTVDLLSDQSIARLVDKMLDGLITEEDELLLKLDDMSEKELDEILLEAQN